MTEFVLLVMLLVAGLLILPELGVLMSFLFIGLPLIFVHRLITRDRAMPPKDRIIALLLCICLSSPVMAGGHQRLVRQSGIIPRQVGTHEGVGMSTRGYEAAKRNACYWGQRTPVSIQYSKRGPYYYAVVRYR